jgi:hypothetical protein
LGLVGIACLVGALQADPTDIGEREYTEHCAVCHGTGGEGNGPMAGIINEKVADLTRLSRDNDGVFPFSTVYDTIDGTREAKGHGTRDMPVWGSVYKQDAPQWLGYDYTNRDAESFVRGRILALIGYLQTLQLE